VAVAAQNGRRGGLKRLASERWKPAHNGLLSTSQTAARSDARRSA
jgi:hypothetical protein